MTFEDILRKHEIDERSIEVLTRNGITNANILQALDNDDIQELGLSIGQRALLKKLVHRFRASSGEETTGSKENTEPVNQNFEKNQDKRERDKSTSNGKNRESEEDTSSSETKKKPKSNDGNKEKTDDLLDNMDEDNFWCIFKCLGGIGAVGLGGLLALVGLVTYGLPVIGFGVAGIVGGSLAAKIMALYGGKVAAGGLVATLQSVAAAGIGWKAILTTLFGSGAVMTAVQGACRHCFK